MLVKAVRLVKDCEWSYCFGANPGTAVGRLRAALFGLGSGSALGSRPRVALSSATASSVYLTALWLDHSFSSDIAFVLIRSGLNASLFITPNLFWRARTCFAAT